MKEPNRDSGGSQPLTSKILTPNGWVLMGNIKKGDFVIGYDGKPTKVVEVYSKGYKDVFIIKTSYGGEIRACADHYWEILDMQDNCIKVLSTKDIMNRDLKSTVYNFRLPTNLPIEFEKKDVKIPPYSLGALIGDGSMIGSHVALANHEKDNEIITRVEKELTDSFNVYCKKQKSSITYRFYNLGKNKGVKGCKEIRVLMADKKEIIFKNSTEASSYFNITKSKINYYASTNKTVRGNKFSYTGNTQISAHPIIEELTKLNLYNKICYNKHIPDLYKYNSIEIRLELLRGLFDTDGTIKKTGEIMFATTSKQLADDVVEIVKSLGGTAKVHKRDRIGSKLKINNTNVEVKRLSYEFTISLNTFNPFFLKRKADRFNSKRKLKYNVILNVTPDNTQEKVQCIKVESDRHLYITDDYTLTYNITEDYKNGIKS